MGEVVGVEVVDMSAQSVTRREVRVAVHRSYGVASYPCDVGKTMSWVAPRREQQCARAEEQLRARAARRQRLVERHSRFRDLGSRLS